jgi:hypothetical protein
MRLNFFIAIACTAAGIIWFTYAQRHQTQPTPTRHTQPGPISGHTPDPHTRQP